MTLGLVILNYNTENTVVSLLNKIKNYSAIDQIVVVDNNSPKDDLVDIRSFVNEKIQLIENNNNSGYAAGNNIGIKALVLKNMDITVVCNPDIVFEEYVIQKIKKVLEENPDIGVLGCSRVNGNHEFTDRQYWSFPTFSSEIAELLFPFAKRKECYKFKSDEKSIFEVDVVPGCFWAARSEVLKRVNYLDENTFLWYEENILAKKIKKAGFKEAILTDACIVNNHDTCASTIVDFNFNSLKIGMKSRFYYLENYSELPKIQLVILRLSSCLNLLIMKGVFLFRKHRS